MTRSTVTGAPVTALLAVIPSAAHEENPLPFDAERLYVISDSRPYLDLQFTGYPPKADDGSARNDGALILHPQRRDWVRWNLAEQLSKDRRMGRHELELKVPRGTVLRCYVIPEKLLSVADIWSMIEEVEQELDRPVAWSAERTRTIRSWVDGTRKASRPLVAELLAEIKRELACALALRRHPPLEPGGSGKHLSPVPELALISRWAVQRCQALSRAEQRLDQERHVLARRSLEYHPDKRRVELTERLQQVQDEVKSICELRSHVLQQVNPSELGSPILPGPLAQRDYRLRQLLRAFAPRTSEIATDRQGRWSQLPPLSLNRLFECWGLVWMVRQLRQLGFLGYAEQVFGSDDMTGCSFVLQRGPIRITLDYEPHPARLNLTDLPSLDQREPLQTAEEWAIRRQLTDPSRPFFGNQDRCSPDYLLRIEGPGRSVLAIGDACLADPRHHSERDKAETLRSYRRSILWAAAVGLTRCDPLGAFVLFPGPAEHWGALAEGLRKEDVWLLCPQARSTDERTRRRFTRMMEHLLAVAAGDSAADPSGVQTALSAH